MKWYMNEEREMLQEAFREFVEKRVQPHVAEMEEHEANSKELIKEMGRLGYLGLTMPEEYGGSGVDYINYGLLIEEISKASPTLGFLVEIAYLFNQELLKPGVCTEEQIQKYAIPAIKGDIVLGLAGNEASGGSFFDGYQTTAVRDGDDWILNGTKVFITEADVADYFIVNARTAEHVDFTAQDMGLKSFMVPADAPGFSVGHIEHKMGLKGSRTGTVYFDNVRVPACDCLPMTAFTSPGEFGGYGAIALGACEAVMEKTKAYLKLRKQYGVSMWDAHEATRNDFGKMYTEVYNFRNAVYGHLANVNCGSETAVVESFALKVQGDDMGKRITDECIMLMGGIGHIYETGLERYFRDMASFTHPCGSDKAIIGGIGMIAD